MAEKDIVLRNFHGDYTLSLAEKNADAKSIHIDNCTLISYPLNLFSTMVNVKKIIIWNTNIVQPLDRNIYASGHKLEEVHFGHNEINEYPLIIFYNTTFEKIRIEAQPQVKIIPKAFAAEAKHLKYFECNDCKINSIEDGSFMNLDKLEDLHLQKNLIENLTDQSFSPLKNLKRLNLAENKISKFTTNILKNSTKIESIDLSNNPIKEFNLLDAEKSLPNLQEVRVINTDIPEALIEEHRRQTNIRFITEKDNKIPH